MVDALDLNIRAFDSMKNELVRHHMGKFVIFHNGKFEGAFDTMNNAGESAVQRFGRGPYLIREVGREPMMHLPASVMFSSIVPCR